MKNEFLFNCIQEIFSRAYGLVTRDDPYPLRSLVRQELEARRPGRILDVGCGSGCYALPGYDYLGVDPNPGYIAFCRRHRPGKFEQMSADHLSFSDKTFDVVLCFSLAHHLPDDSLRRAYSEIRRVMADDGLLIFADPVRPIVRSRWIASILEWLDEGHWFRQENDYVDLLAREFQIERKLKITDQFYNTLVLFCRKNPNHESGGI